jgi:transcriptional regulator with XRE-family HTH domain
MTSDLLTPTLAELAARRGYWPDICRATGLDYNWITKLAQGRISDPGVRKIQRLATHFATHARRCEDQVSTPCIDRVQAATETVEGGV